MFVVVDAFFPYRYTLYRSLVRVGLEGFPPQGAEQASHFVCDVLLGWQNFMTSRRDLLLWLKQSWVPAAGDVAAGVLALGATDACSPAPATTLAAVAQEKRAVLAPPPMEVCEVLPQVTIVWAVHDSLAVDANANLRVWVKGCSWWRF